MKDNYLRQWIAWCKIKKKIMRIFQTHLWKPPLGFEVTRQGLKLLSLSLGPKRRHRVTEALTVTHIQRLDICTWIGGAASTYKLLYVVHVSNPRAGLKKNAPKATGQNPPHFRSPVLRIDSDKPISSLRHYRLFLSCRGYGTAGLTLLKNIRKITCAPENHSESCLLVTSKFRHP
jgi:hypothetical protein